ncbi:MAG: 50S ribosomal protein L10 [Sphaerochaetaceae bacterium]|jgi:large subunit ribosomal protein L10|nr:50S ribosomal protein L10 [Sphaerochaetaceae bacterium]MDX9808549.1 50S ribosomal protein L10 [Sphaerochaetaceae bacterium]NLV83924.1 50S ribosomal protein L10 [Spirochaetales bacterium]
MAKFEARKAQEKIDAVQEITSEFSQYDSYIFTDYRGMTVEQITNLRNQLRGKEAGYRVVKNRFAKIALNNLNHTGTDKSLTGPTAIALVRGEDASNAVSKILFDFSKGAPLQVKGAYIAGKVYDQTQIEAYSKLPSRSDLIAMLMGTMKEPLAKFVRTLQAIVDANQN